MIGINVLNLKCIDLATQEDIDNGLVYWGKLFMVTTWEELQSLVQGHEDAEEVADMILELNTDNQAKEILEGQRRYREQMATAQACLLKAQKIQKEYEDLSAEIAEKKRTIAENERTIAENEQTIAQLQAEIERLKKEK